MKTLLNIYRNWRTQVLTALVIIDAVLLLSESDNQHALIITKTVGFALAYGIYKLTQHWHDKGKIDKLKQIED